MNWTEFAQLVLIRLDIAILIYFLIVNGFYLVLLCAAYLEMREHLRKQWGEVDWRVLGSDVAPSLTMLAPAYNEEATVVQSIRALLTLQYPDLEVMVINDGSSDTTLQTLVDEFEMYPVYPIYRRRVETQPVTGIYRSAVNPNLVVVDKENGGKADALNVGINVASGDLVCAIDADTLIESDALLRMVRPFLLNEEVVAAGATIRIVNSSEVKAGRVVSSNVPRNPLAGFQVGEYLRAFLFGRLGWNRLGGNLIISGAFGLFRREQVLEVGGYLHDTVGEDMELVARLRRNSYLTGGPKRVEFIPDPVAWTEAPESIRVLGRQRDRWHRGLSDVLWRYRGVMFNPRYRAFGLVVYPYFFFVELLAPVIELIGLLGLGIGLLIGAINVPFAILFFLVAYGLGAVLTLFTLVLEEISYHRYDSVGGRARMVMWALLENLGYRQMTVVWRIRGIVKYLRGRKDWGAMTRTGFTVEAGIGEVGVLESKPDGDRVEV
jgi:cellulose synthase/poly-beta-1,6-N-acetylglucosamine synthase-like glycosyltransferase